MNQQIKYTICYVGILLSLISCNSTIAPNGITEFIHSQITFPPTLQAYKFKEQDTTKHITPSLYRLVVYTNSSECDDCKLQTLRIWKKALTDTSIIASSNTISCSFIFHPKRLEVMLSNLITHNFDLPVFYDPDGAFERANPQLPENPVFHTFLLDKDNRVVLVGSPIGNPKMWELYKSTIDRLVENGGTLPPESSDDE